MQDRAAELWEVVLRMESSTWQPQAEIWQLQPSSPDYMFCRCKAGGQAGALPAAPPARHVGLLCCRPVAPPHSPPALTFPRLLCTTCSRTRCL